MAKFGWMGMAGRTMQQSHVEMLLQGRYLATERGWLHLHLLCCLLETSCFNHLDKQLLKARHAYCSHRNI
ncbi:hypothetical protein BM449_07820 [Synechococcus sp. SynAce01]|nr:hypothetical protein BM449_07820 [Synechococcus sp. SynAce01]